MSDDRLVPHVDERISILVVDDDADIRLLLQMRLDLEPDMVVVGTAADGDQAVEQWQRLRPAVVVMDLLMPGTDGLEAIARIQEEEPDSLIVAYTSAAGPLVDRQVAKRGVAMVRKSGDSRPLIEAIRELTALPGL